MPTDDWLLQLASRYHYSITTNDVYLKVRAAALGIETHGYGNEEDYSGISYFNLEENQDLINNFYSGEDIEIPSIGRKLKENEYLIVETGDSPIIFKKKDGKIQQVMFSTIKNMYINEIKPKNSEQVCFFDALNTTSNSIIFAGGSYGRGKSYIANNYALAALEKAKINKIIYIPNNSFVANSMEIGALPGDILEKTVGQIGPLIDLIGFDRVKGMIANEELEIVPMANARGRSFSKSIVLVNEAQNLTQDHVKLLIGRVGEESRIIFDGDQSQADSSLFKDRSGLKLLLKLSDSDCYSKIFSAIRLIKSERSFTASAADYLETLS